MEIINLVYQMIIFVFLIWCISLYLSDEPIFNKINIVTGGTLLLANLIYYGLKLFLDYDVFKAPLTLLEHINFFITLFAVPFVFGHKFIVEHRNKKKEQQN